nr:hypothetical protein [uncultured Anaerobutyricum sp.]
MRFRSESKMRMRLSSEQAVVFCSRPPSLCKDYCIHSLRSQHTEKRNNPISQMRLRSVSKMRMRLSSEQAVVF